MLSIVNKKSFIVDRLKNCLMTTYIVEKTILGELEYQYYIMT